MRALSVTLASAAAFGAVDALAVLQGGWLLLVGNLVAVWLTVGFIAGRRAHHAHGAMLLGLAAETAAVIGFYLVKFATEGVPWGVATLYLVAALATGPLSGWLGYSSVHGRGAVSLFTLAGIWAGEPLGWIGLQRLRTGQVSVGADELVLAGAELLVGLFIGLAAFKATSDWRGKTSIAR